MNDSWHVPGALLQQYADGTLTDPVAFSVETHVAACHACRSASARHVAPARLDALWTEVVDVVDAPRPGVIEALLHRLGVSPSTARLLCVTPALRAPWLAAVGLVLSTAVLAAHGHAGQRSGLVLLILAPLVPVAGTAFVFESRLEATAELTKAAPVSGFWLALVRTASVLVTSVCLAGVASLLVPRSGWLALGWLVPALALTLATLALTSWLSPAVAAGAIGSVWLIGVLGNEVVATGGLAGLGTPGPIRALAFHPAGQLALALVALGAAALTMLRRESFELEMEGWW